MSEQVRIRVGTGLGIASLVIGIFAALFCWVPLLGLLALPLVGISLILGVIGVIFGSIERSGLGLPIAGLIVSVVAALVSVHSTGATVKAFDQAKIAGNEASAISSLRAISTFNEQFRTRFGTYAGSLMELEREGYVDWYIGSGEKSGYVFQYQGADTSWTCRAVPVEAGQSGARHFFCDETGVIRSSDAAPVDASSPPV